ncbi:MAG: translation initiation factor [Campylobacterales bacterium]|nr:translation initiation factor [Campylobacterales bacterium]
MFEIGAKFEDDWSVDSLCKKCGENKSSCKCKDKKILEIQEHQLKISIEKRKNKVVTVGKEFYLDKKDLKELLGFLKKRIGVGGSMGENHIELQGKVQEKLKELLREKGFKIK